MKTDLMFSHDREPVQMYTFLENRTGSLIEPGSGSQISLYHFYWVPLVLLLTWDCYSSPVAITFFLILLLLSPLLFFSLSYYYSSLLLLLLFSHYYCSLFIGITLLFITIYFFPIALILFLLLLLWCRSFRVMKSFNY
jgi:hypothetical protein